MITLARCCGSGRVSANPQRLPICPTLFSRAFCSQFHGEKRQLAPLNKKTDIKTSNNAVLSPTGSSLFRGSLFTGTDSVESTDEMYGKWAEAYDQDMSTLKFDSLATMPLKIEEYLLKQSLSDSDDDDLDKEPFNALRIAYDHELTAANTKILDVGCGTGLLGELLLDKRSENDTETESDGELVIDGMDLTQEMLDILEKERGGFYNSVQQHDITSAPWPFDDDTYDLTVCNGVLVYVKDNISECLDEFVRVTKPGGYCLLMLRQDCLHEFSAKIYQLLTEKKWQIAEITDTRFNFKTKVNDKHKYHVPYNHHIFQVL